MDCNENANTRMDPVERLGKLREMFFAQDQSLGQNRMPLTTQRQQGYPENARWTKEGVVFATLNAPGPSDNLALRRRPPRDAEAVPAGRPTAPGSANLPARQVHQRRRA